MKGPLRFGLVLVCLGFGCGNVVDDEVISQKRSPEAEKTARTLRRTIPEEIETLGDHPWAGQYYFGDGLGVNVSLFLAPKAGYLFEWHGCLGLYDRNYGAVTADNGRLRLSFTFPNKREGFQGIAEELILIPWGERRYLVPSDDLVGFCNEVNSGREPRKFVRGGFYLLRQGDEKKRVQGLPVVPEKYRPHLLAQPIEATIIGVGKSTTRTGVADIKFKNTPVTLNCGKSQGLLEGMELHVILPEDCVESVKIKSVAESKAEAVMTQVGEEEKRPEAGWRLSTRYRWHVEEPDGTTESKEGHR